MLRMKLSSYVISMHFCQNSVAADLAHSIYGEAKKRELLQILKQLSFTQDYIRPLGRGNRFPSTIYACGPLERPPVHPGNMWPRLKRTG